MPQSHAIVQRDMRAARNELADSQYGQYANAEELIRAHIQSTPEEVKQATRRGVNELATRSLNFDSIDVPKGCLLLNACVRGSYVSYVFETPDGNVLHGAQRYHPSEHAASTVQAAVESQAATRAIAEDAGHIVGPPPGGEENETEVASAAAKKSAKSDGGAGAVKENKAPKQPENDPTPGGDGDEGGNDDSTDEVEEFKMPRSHDDLNQLAKELEIDGWDDSSDTSVKDKQAAIEQARAAQG